MKASDHASTISRPVLLFPVALVAAQTYTIEPISTSDDASNINDSRAAYSLSHMKQAQRNDNSPPCKSTILNPLPTTTTPATIPISISSTENENTSSTDTTAPATSSSNSVTLSTSTKTTTNQPAPQLSSTASRSAASSSAALLPSASPSPPNIQRCRRK
ncbi:hypothetical protein F5146DRAFT_999233 [Armillaria mellea]|nr:hypothetical protein F5146DRAFT_999233 [Armillaria mellea]